MPTTNSQHHELIVLGSGPAGCTAAIYSARANLKPLMISGAAQGGQLLIAAEIENWPGEPEGIAGPILMQHMLKQVEKFSVPIINDHISHVDLKRRPFYLKGEHEYFCDALIIATGASAKKLGLPSEEKFNGRGVSYCATCDGFFYKGKKVAVIGGGNSAVDEALNLANIVEHVILIHRRDSFRAEPILIDKLVEAQRKGKVTLELNSIVEEILGNEKNVTGIQIRNVLHNTVKKIDVAGVFIAVGHTPNTEIFANQLEMDNNYLLVSGGSFGAATQTSIAGIFAAGDVCDPVYKQAIVAAGAGCMAALDAKRYLGK